MYTQEVQVFCLVVKHDTEMVTCTGSVVFLFCGKTRHRDGNVYTQEVRVFCFVVKHDTEMVTCTGSVFVLFCGKTRHRDGNVYVNHLTMVESG